MILTLIFAIFWTQPSFAQPKNPFSKCEFLLERFSGDAHKYRELRNQINQSLDPYLGKGYVVLKSADLFPEKDSLKIFTRFYNQIQKTHGESHPRGYLPYRILRVVEDGRELDHLRVSGFFLKYAEFITKLINESLEPEEKVTLELFHVRIQTPESYEKYEKLDSRDKKQLFAARWHQDGSYFTVLVPIIGDGTDISELPESYFQSRGYEIEAADQRKINRGEILIFNGRFREARIKKPARALFHKAPDSRENRLLMVLRFKPA